MAGAGGILVGLLFGAALLALAGLGGWRAGRPALVAAASGLLVGLALIALSMVARRYAVALPLGHAAPFGWWVLATTLVAGAEEAVLRGALFGAIERAGGPLLALGTTSVAFALLHVPLDGPSVVPLDLAVGLVLGGLRLWSGGVAAPAVAHAVADLAAWFL